MRRRGKTFVSMVPLLFSAAPSAFLRPRFCIPRLGARASCPPSVAHRVIRDTKKVPIGLRGKAGRMPALPGRQAGRSAFNPSAAAMSRCVAGSLRRAEG